MSEAQVDVDEVQAGGAVNTDSEEDSELGVPLPDKLSEDSNPFKPNNYSHSTRTKYQPSIQTPSYFELDTTYPVTTHSPIHSFTLLTTYTHEAQPPPVYRIPFEILTEIFDFCVHGCFSSDSDNNDLYPPTQAEWMAPLILSHVCSSWRASIFSYQWAWTHIRIAPTRRDPASGLRAWLQLSGIQPLHVVVDDYRFEGRFPQNAILSLFRDLVCSGRLIQSLRLCVKAQLMPRFQNVMTANPSVMRNIRDLRFDLHGQDKRRIYMYDPQWELWQPQEPQVLRSFSQSFWTSPQLALRSLYATLACLDLHGYLAPSPRSVLESIQYCLLLETLNIQLEFGSLEGQVTHSNLDTRNRVKLHNLKHLTVRDDAEDVPGVWRHFGSSWILGYLETPSLETLGLHWTRGYRSVGTVANIPGSFTMLSSNMVEQSHQTILANEILAFIVASKLKDLHTLSLYACEIKTYDIARWLCSISNLKHLYIHAISPDKCIYDAILRHHLNLEELCVGRVSFFYPLNPLLNFVSDWVLGSSIQPDREEASKVLNVGFTEERTYEEMKRRAEQVKEPKGCVDFDCVPRPFPLWKCAVYEQEPRKLMWRFIRFRR